MWIDLYILKIPVSYIQYPIWIYLYLWKFDFGEKLKDDFKNIIYFEEFIWKCFQMRFYKGIKNEPSKNN